MGNLFDTIIFDFDYTLADSSRGVIESMNFAFERMDLPAAPPEDICKTIGLTLPEAFRKLAGDERPEKADEFFRLFVERADEVMVDLTLLFPDVPDTVQELKRRDIALGIVSTKYRYRIEAILRRENLLDSFSVIVGGSDVSEQKPSPEGLLKAVNGLNGACSRALYVGDSLVDAETARRARVPFVAVLSGTTEKNDFRDYKVYKTIHVLRDLLEIIGN